MNYVSLKSLIELGKKYFIIILSVFISIISIAGSGVYLYINKCPKCEECEKMEINQLENETKEIKDALLVDVKGAVKKTGVYTLESGATVMDAIKEAGGITKDATTKNINLSKKLTDEMVIYVYTKKELKNETLKNEIPCVCETITINECLDDENSNKGENKKISINTGTIDELETLDGIGEAKAKAIIEYRSNNGLFKSIEDIKNVSGIGESAYQKIKDYITV